MEKVTSLITYRADRAARADFEKRDELLGQEFRLRVNVSRLHAHPDEYARYNKVGLNLYGLGALEEAEIFFRRGLALARRDGDRNDISMLLYNLANTLFEQNNPARNWEIWKMAGECINLQDGLTRPSEEVLVRASQIINKIDIMDGYNTPHLQ